MVIKNKCIKNKLLNKGSKKTVINLKTKHFNLDFKKSLSLFIILFMVLCSIITVNAKGSTFQKPSFLNRYDVYSGGSDYFPNLSEFPFNKRASAIGFNKLYGDNKSFIVYKGEVPNKIAEEDYAKDYRTFGSSTIDGKTRPWTANTEIEEDDLTVDSEDIHISSMTVSTSDFNPMSILLAIVSAINWLFSQLVNLMITFKSIDLSTIINAIDSSGDLSDKLAKIFLISPSDNTISPFLIFGIVLFLGSFIMLAFKAIRGRASFRNIASELGFFILAVLIAGSFLTSTNANKFSNMGINILNKLTNDISSGGNDSTAIFTYETGETSLDNSETQRALINQTYVDQLIEAQFGYSVSDLYLTTSSGGQGSFGDLTNINEAIKETFGSTYDRVNAFQVTTDITGTRSVNNLGYYLWAANSSVYIYNGSSGGSAFYQTAKGTNVKGGSSDRILYVIDFLNSLRKISDADGASDVVSKIDNIIVHLQSPDYGSAIMNILAVCIQNLMLAFSLMSITVFCLIGQVIVILGSFCMVVMPILLLYSKTRTVAKEMMYSYLLGYLRYLLGTALFNAVLLVTTLLSQQGFGGILVSILACFLVGKFGPDLIKKLNEVITRAGRGKELRPMSSLYNKIDNGFGKYGNSARKRRNASTKIIDENGNVTEKGTFSDRFHNIISGNRSKSDFNSNGDAKLGFDHLDNIIDKYDEDQQADLDMVVETQKDDKNSRSEGNRESNNTSTDSNNDKNRDNHSNNNSNNNNNENNNVDVNNDNNNKSNSERNLLQDGSNNNDKNNSSERDLLYDNSQHSDTNNINNDKNSNLEDIVVDTNDNNTDISSSNLREKNPNISIDNDGSVDNGNSNNNNNSSNNNNNDQESPSFNDNSASTRDLLGENQLMIANDQTDEANIDQDKNIETPPNIDLSDLTKNNENNHEISDEEKIAEMERREKQRIKHNIKLKAVAAIPIIGMDLNQRMTNKTTMENTAKKKLLNETNKVLNQNKGQSMTLNQAMNQAIDNITANSRAKDKKYETKRLEQAKQKVTKFDVNTNIDLIKEAKKKKLNNNNNNNNNNK